MTISIIWPIGPSNSFFAIYISKLCDVYKNDQKKLFRNFLILSHNQNRNNELTKLDFRNRQVASVCIAQN